MCVRIEGGPEDLRGMLGLHYTDTSPVQSSRVVTYAFSADLCYSLA
jgi:hypothetical protein